MANVRLHENILRISTQQNSLPRHGNEAIPMKPQHCAAFLLMACCLASGDTIDVLGQKLSFSKPSGYCTLGNTQRERELLDVSQRAVGPGSRIVQAVVRCAELDAFKRGTKEELDH